LGFYGPGDEGSIPMHQDPCDDGQVFDARYHPQPSMAAGAHVDLDREHLLQALRPALLDRARCCALVRALLGALSARTTSGRRDRRTKMAARSP
jgi:hypothetical protein